MSCVYANGFAHSFLLGVIGLVVSVHLAYDLPLHNTCSLESGLLIRRFNEISSARPLTSVL